MKSIISKRYYFVLDACSMLDLVVYSVFATNAVRCPTC